ncbi:MAG: hypothetical protein SF069_11795 [Phycisphaerae bacterium]|nr:hypothetical protein [Phycisphaerae bacterium]
MQFDFQADARRRKAELRRLKKVVATLREPELRLGDIAGIEHLAGGLLAQPDDPHLSELFSQCVEQQYRAAQLDDDPFRVNPPPLGVLPDQLLGRFPILTLPSGEVVSVPLTPPQHMVFSGPTGSGKTTLLRTLLVSCIANRVRAIAFDRKRGELIDAAILSAARLPVTFLNWHELKIALTQPPPGVAALSYAHTLVHTIARESHLQASRRLMLDTLVALMKKSRRTGVWPRLAEWIKALEAVAGHPASRIGAYREAAVMALRQIQHECGAVLDYAKSDCLDRVLSYEGVMVICTEGLSSPMQALLSSLILTYCYRARQCIADDLLAPVYFVIDDSLSLAHGSGQVEAAGEITPLAEMFAMARSRRMGLIAATQVYELLSPALRANTGIVICTGAYGTDAEAVSRRMNLTPQQTAHLALMQPGEAVACIPGFRAMYGSVPMLP